MRMSKYKRLTERRGNLIIDNCGNCPNIRNPQGCTYEDCYEIIKNRLAELEDKIENGILIELPCKVGNVVYEVFKNHKPPYIQQTKIEKVIITNKGLRLKLERNSVYETSVSSIGKTLFNTQEEAEKILKELKNETI